MAGELAAVAADADADDAVRVVVVTGTGRAFCAGADLGGGPGTFAGRRTRQRPPGPLGEDIGGVPRDAGGVAALPFAALRKPVIAAGEGPAGGVGGGGGPPKGIAHRPGAAPVRVVVRRGGGRPGGAPAGV